MLPQSHKNGLCAQWYSMDCLQVVTDHPVPEAPPGWAWIRVRAAGICQTDLEIVKGYMGFQGILGHEFVGTVDDCDDPGWIGRRVTAEINAACGRCDWCRQGLARHCPRRSVLGILALDGCMADYCVVPVANLHGRCRPASRTRWRYLPSPCPLPAKSWSR